MKEIVPYEIIEQRIFFIRGCKVMLDKDLAELYKVKPIALRQQVKRNRKRFPKDFMFLLTAEEVKILVSQNVIPSYKSLGGYSPYAFTEQGVAMLSSILHSGRAVQVNIQIMRTFIKLRQMLISHAELKQKLEEMEQKYDRQFKMVFDAIKKLVEPQSPPPKRQIGFHAKGEKNPDAARIQSPQPV